MSNLPNVFIVGAPRAGTTAICDILQQHPNIFIPKIKEPRFFIGEEITEVCQDDPLKKFLTTYSVLEKRDYLKLYSTTHKIKIDPSVQYLYHYKSVIPKIKKVVPDAKILIILRNPVKRAFSNYQFLREAISPNTFEKELEMESQRIRENWNSFWFYKSQSSYYEGVKAYMDSFENVKIIVFEEFLLNKSKVMKEIMEFISLSSNHNFSFSSKKVNRSGKPRNSFLNSLIFKDSLAKKLIRLMLNLLPNAFRKNMVLKIKNVSRKNNDELTDKNIEAKLREEFMPEVIQLEKLIGKNLSQWK